MFRNVPGGNRPYAAGAAFAPRGGVNPPYARARR